MWSFGTTRASKRLRSMIESNGIYTEYYASLISYLIVALPICISYLNCPIIPNPIYLFLVYDQE